MVQWTGCRHGIADMVAREVARVARVAREVARWSSGQAADTVARE